MKAVHDSETKAEGRQVITACAFVHATFEGKTKVFFPKRADTKKFLPGRYELPGGHIDFGEDIEAGLRREIKEELGMDVSVGDAFAAFTYTNEIKGSHSIEVIYFAQFTNPLDAIQLNPEDHSSYAWLGEDELSVIEESKGSDDPEFRAIMKGFAFLRGESPLFA